MATNKQEQAKAIYELWDVILQHRWRFVLPAFAVTAAVLFVSLFLPRKYEAVAYFERSIDPVMLDVLRRGASDSYIDPMAALTEEITGSHPIAQVINELEPKLRESGYVSNDTELRELRNSVSQQLIVRREYADKARVNLRIELVLDDPYISAMIVNELVDRYMRTTRDAMLERTSRSTAYYENEIKERRKELEARQNELGQFEQKHAMLLPDQPYSVQAQLLQAQEQLAMLMTNLEGLDIQRRSLTDALKEEPETLPSIVHGKNPERIRLETKLETLQDKIREYTTTMRMTEQHPEVVALRKQQTDLEAKIDSTQTNVVTSTEEHPNPKRSELELALTSANAERDALKQQISLRHKKIDELSAKSAEILPVRAEHNKLVNAVNEAQKNIDGVQASRRQLILFLTPETADRGVQMEFVRRAEPVSIPVSPNLLQVIIVAGFLGISSGALSVFIAYRNDESYRNARQLAGTTTIPVLGSVSELITRQHRRMRRIRYSILYPANACAMACVLLLFGSLLYLDLQRPDVLEKLKDQAKEMLVINPSEEASDPPTSVGLRSPDKPQG